MLFMFSLVARRESNSTVACKNFYRFSLLRQNLCVQSYKEFDGVNFSSTKAWTKVPASIESQRFKLT